MNGINDVLCSETVTFVFLGAVMLGLGLPGTKETPDKRRLFDLVKSSGQRTLSKYEVLGISKTATSEEIKAAYRKWAFIYHPDKCKQEVNLSPEEACPIFLLIQQANVVLSDPEQKAIYDESLSKPSHTGIIRFELLVKFKPECTKHINFTT